MSEKLIKSNEPIQAEKPIIPFGFLPRDYQKHMLQTMSNGKIRRAFLVWHRRAGKDITCWAFLLSQAALPENSGESFYYCLPQFRQGRKIIWEGGFMSMIPKQWVKEKNEQEMKIVLANNAIIRVIGTDNYDSIRGTDVKGVIMSEYAFQNTGAWEVISPILAQNKGFAVFNTTPKGKNHAYNLYRKAENSDWWYTSCLTYKDTGVFDGPEGEREIEQERMQKTPEQFAREYECSFEPVLEQSIYGPELQTAQATGRVAKLPVKQGVPMHFSVDIGVSDHAVIWGWQLDGQMANMVYYYEEQNKYFEHYASEIEEICDRYKVPMGKLFVPHDANQRHSSSGGETVYTKALSKWGGRHVVLLPRAARKHTDIQFVRGMFPRICFDENRVFRGLQCLEMYAREFDEHTNTYKESPRHDEFSHGADAFRYAMHGIHQLSENNPRYNQQKEEKWEDYRAFLGR